MDVHLICIWYGLNEKDGEQSLEMELKQEKHRVAHLGTTIYVMNINLIWNWYDFDMYFIKYQLNKWMIKSGLG